MTLVPTKSQVSKGKKFHGDGATQKPSEHRVGNLPSEDVAMPRCEEVNYPWSDDYVLSVMSNGTTFYRSDDRDNALSPLDCGMSWFDEYGVPTEDFMRYNRVVRDCIPLFMNVTTTSNLDLGYVTNVIHELQVMRRYSFNHDAVHGYARYIGVSVAYLFSKIEKASEYYAMFRCPSSQLPSLTAMDEHSRSYPIK